MGKNINFSGQPIFNQLLKFIDKREIRKKAKLNEAERCVKKFTKYDHVVVMLFVSIEGYYSLRETILGLLANAHKLSHLGCHIWFVGVYFQRQMGGAKVMCLEIFT